MFTNYVQKEVHIRETHAPARREPAGERNHFFCHGSIRGETNTLCVDLFQSH